jgi:hypothetical protein
VNVPIRFPAAADVIADEAAHFQALTDEERVKTLGELFRLYHFLLAQSDRPEALARLASEDEEQSRRAIEEFVARHG